MRNAKMVVCLGAFAACIGAPSLSVAEDNCSGYWVQIGATIVLLNNDPSAPSHMAIGICQISRCTYKDKEGDSWTDQSAYPGGGWDKGTWETVSGTGKYANAKNSGWTERKRMESGGPDGYVRIGAWGGSCK
jgi:hypothetical protein